MTRRGVWFYFAVSVLLHVGVLALLPGLPDGSRAIRRATPLELRIRETRSLDERELTQRKSGSSRRAVQKTPDVTPPAMAEPAVEPPTEAVPVEPAETKAVKGPTIDLDAARALAMQIAREEAWIREELLLESRRLDEGYLLARGIAHATVADCRTAYSGLLLLAVPMLVLDALRDGGCRW